MKYQDPFDTQTRDDRLKASHALDWEEAALDEQSDVEGFFESQRPAASLVWLSVVLLAMALVLLGKLFSLQILHGGDYRALAQGNRIRNQILLAPRGKILDRYGQTIAQNAVSFSLAAAGADLPPEPRLSQEIKELSQVFGLDEADVSAKLSKLSKNLLDPIVIKQGLSAVESILFETNAGKYPGFSIQKIPIRDYVNAQVFSHVLGYTGIVSDQELNQGSLKYASSDYIGKLGLELAYDEFLRGENGEDQIEVDALGKVVKELGRQDPRPGKTLELNLDKALQEVLYENFMARSAKVRGAAVALNPKTGQILALLSLPGFDNNLFARGIQAKDYDKLIGDKSLPLFNRAIAGTYPPGSTVKPMAAVGALESATVHEDTVIVDRGVISVPNQFDSKQQTNFYGWKRSGLGPVTVKSAIAESSDIYFYTAAGGQAGLSIKGMGPGVLADYYRRFNLGSLTGIDLPGEKPGLVPDPAWKAEHFKSDPVLSKWYLGDTYHIGIGQGDLLATPLQAALWTAIIANNGVGYRPFLVNKILDEAGKTLKANRPEVLIPKFASEENLKIVQAGMRLAVTGGTARQLASLPISSAGKTGTSQFDDSSPSRTHAWFTAYAPFEDPQIVITVLVEAGGEGSAEAEPIVKNALAWWAENRLHK